MNPLHNSAHSLNIIILAAGRGTRMHSAMPKVLHQLAGVSLLNRVLNSARALKPARLIVVYGHGADQIRAHITEPDIEWVLQDEQKGTGHAVQLAMNALNALNQTSPQNTSLAAASTLILYGDVPLISVSTLQRLCAAQTGQLLALLTAHTAQPQGYGRIVRLENHQVQRIIEEKDASEQERAITEINTGILIAPTHLLARWITQLTPQNAQGEYYLTDIVAMAATDSRVTTCHPDNLEETLGINSRAQLAHLERVFQLTQASHLMNQGVTLRDPARIDIRGNLQCAQDVVIDVNCIFEGQVEIGAQTDIGANCVIKNAKIGSGVKILPFTHIDGAIIGSGALIGPYARLRPGSVLAENTHVGNFVELKNTCLGAGSKANHLAYLGDAEIGARVNVGAGTITCNYDGVNKHKTIIEDDAFIGSDSQLVAPVRIGKGATLAAGTTLTQNAPPDTLTLSRVEQISRVDWRRPQKK